MAKNRNEFTGDLKAFIATGVDLGHLLVFVPWLHKLAEPTLKKSNLILKKHGAPPNSFGPATGCSIINIFHEGEYIIRAPVGKLITRGKNVKRMAEEVEGRTNALLLCVLHENSEIYVKNLYGNMLFRLRNKVSLPGREAFHKKNPKWRDYKNTANYFKDYAEFECQSDCSKALRAFFSELDWDLVHVKSYPGTDLRWGDLAKLLSFCRNCIVHNEGRVSETRMKRINMLLKKHIQTIMKTTILSNDERILPDKQTVKGFIEAMLSFAYGLYVLVSKRCGQDVEFDPWKS